MRLCALHNLPFSGPTQVWWLRVLPSVNLIWYTRIPLYPFIKNIIAQRVFFLYVLPTFPRLRLVSSFLYFFFLFFLRRRVAVLLEGMIVFGKSLEWRILYFPYNTFLVFLDTPCSSSATDRHTGSDGLDTAHWKTDVLLNVDATHTDEEYPEHLPTRRQYDDDAPSLRLLSYTPKVNIHKHTLPDITVGGRLYRKRCWGGEERTLKILSFVYT